MTKRPPRFWALATAAAAIHTAQAYCGYSLERCRTAALHLGLELGTSNLAFAGRYSEAGCFAYTTDSVFYPGTAFYGLVDNGFEVQEESELRALQLPKYRLPGTYACAHVDLALERLAVASSVQFWQGQQLKASNAVDGNPATRWSSAHAAPQWIYVDLGNLSLVSRIVIEWEEAYAATYQLQAAIEGTDEWTPLMSVQGNAGAVISVLPPHSIARYIRVLCQTRGEPDFGFSMYSLQIFGTHLANTFRLTSATYRDFDNHRDACVQEFEAGADVADWADLEALGSQSVDGLFSRLGVTVGESYIVSRNGATCSAHGTYFFQRHEAGPPLDWTNATALGDIYLWSWYLESARVLCKVEASNPSDVIASDSCDRSCHGTCERYTTADACPHSCAWINSTCETRNDGGDFRLTQSLSASTDDHFAACQAEFGHGSHVADWTHLEALGNESVNRLMEELSISPTFGQRSYIVTWNGATCSSNGVYFFERHDGDGQQDWNVLSTIGGIDLGTAYFMPHDNLTGFAPVLCKVGIGGHEATATARATATGVIVATVGSLVVASFLISLAYWWYRYRRKQETLWAEVTIVWRRCVEKLLLCIPGEWGDAAWRKCCCCRQAPEDIEAPRSRTPRTRRLSASESRQLGISLHFVTRILPDEAQAMATRLVQDVLPKKSHPSADEAKLLSRYGSARGWRPSIWGPEEIKVQDMTFIELSRFIAYGDVAYGKGITCPRDGVPDCSIVDAVYPRGFSQRATLFLSWVWGYKFATALSGLKNYIATHPDLDPEECFIWWCFFQNNQFRMLGSGEKQSFDSLRVIFGTQLRNVGRMVSMMDRVSDSTYSQRLWCLFEVYVAAQDSIEIEVMLPGDPEREMENMIQRGGFRALKRAIDEVAAENATASFPEDQQGIQALIESMPGSYTTLNAVVQKSLKQSLQTFFGKALGSYSPGRTAAFSQTQMLQTQMFSTRSEAVLSI